MMRKQSGVLREGRGSDDENEVRRRGNASADRNSHLLANIQRLKEDDDIFRCQIEALRNDSIQLRAIHAQTMEQKDNYIDELRIIENTLDKSRDALIRLSEIRSKEFAEFKRRMEEDTGAAGPGVLGPGAAASTSSSNVNREKEARLISLISIFLHVLPFGANVDHICSYLHGIDSTIKAEDVENLLEKYPSIFKQNSTDPSARLGRNWKFIGFHE